MLEAETTMALESVAALRDMVHEHGEHGALTLERLDLIARVIEGLAEAVEDAELSGPSAEWFVRGLTALADEIDPR